MWPFRKKKADHEINQKRLDAFGLLAVVSSQCIGPNRLPVMHGIRENPNNVSDSGWMLSSGLEPAGFESKADNYNIVPLERMIQTDATLAALRDFPEGTEITRKDITEPWRFIVNDQVVDADGKVVGRCD
ncbi:MAG TPA: DUF2185 domain-containing protein [Verrucomicrobiae bacterium]|nr:DUF2185 domain-containing protein [Verrucomicrobiae bacterium]